MPRPTRAFKTAVSDFVDDDVLTLAAALAYYAALALAPVLLILLSIAGFLGQDTEQALVHRVESLVGPKAGSALNTIIASAQQQGTSAGTVSFIVGLGVLLVSATGVLSQLQYSLNRIWTVEVKPGQVLWDWLRKRAISLVIILVVGFLLIASVFVSAALTAVLPDHAGSWGLPDFLVSLAVFIVLFAIIIKYLPDVKLRWRDVWLGALATAVLFDIGKYGMGKYLGHSSVGSSYGAAGSLVVLLVWIYYASLILFFGVELTQASVRAYEVQVAPVKHARWMRHNKFKRQPDAPHADSP